MRMTNNFHIQQLIIAATIFIVAAFLPSSASSQFVFEDATESSKIFQSVAAVADIGGGVVVVDLNNDGWEDLYLPGAAIADKLYLNQKDGTFKDVTPEIFAKHNNFNSYTQGGIALDFNKDGNTDIFEVCRRKDLLWKNNGDGTFINYSQPANILEPFDENVSNSATFGDFDGDGDNDIYVARWIRSFDAVLDSSGNSQYVITGFPNHFYVNNGNSSFTEKGFQFGVDDSGSTNTAIMFDYDMDGDLDILTGNDFGMLIKQNSVYENQLAQTGIATFIDVAKSKQLDVKIYNMTMTPNDYDRDGDFDLFQTSIGGVYLYNNSGGSYSNVAQSIGFPPLVVPGIFQTPHITWTTLFEDFDNDGRQDVYVVHGYLRALIESLATLEYDTTCFYRQKADTTFIDVTTTEGIPTDVRGRGAAALDYDHDGRLDLVLGSLGRIPGVKTADYRIYHNITPSSPDRNWLQIKCTAITTAPEAIGTIIEVWTDGILHLKQISTNGGFGSCSSLIQHFGVGSATTIDSVIIKWPMSKSMHRQIDKYYNVPANQLIYYTELPKQSVSADIKTDIGFSLFPTIAEEKITIRGAEQGKDTRYEILNPLGVSFETFEGRINEVELPISTLPSGQYFVKITSDGHSVIRKFVKIAR